MPLKRLCCALVLLSMAACGGGDKEADLTALASPSPSATAASDDASATPDASGVGTYVSTEGTPPPEGDGEQRREGQEPTSRPKKDGPRPTEEPEKPDARPAQTTDAQGNLTMPVLVGSDLKYAKERLRDEGFTGTISTFDAGPKDRKIEDAEDWWVCTQSPKAGAKVPPDTTVKLGAMKDGQECPS
jgi:hypothetical protein